MCLFFTFNHFPYFFVIEWLSYKYPKEVFLHILLDLNWFLIRNFWSVIIPIKFLISRVTWHPYYKTKLLILINVIAIHSTKRTGVIAIKLGMIPQWTKEGEKVMCTVLQVSIHFVFMLVFIMCKYFAHCFLLLSKANSHLLYILRSFDFASATNTCTVKCAWSAMGNQFCVLFFTSLYLFSLWYDIRLKRMKLFFLFLDFIISMFTVTMVYCMCKLLETKICL